MAVSIALLRGINVGGRASLPMKDLTALLSALGLRDVKTYVQSGNVVFRHGNQDLDRLSRRIGREIETRHGFAPAVLLLDVDRLDRVVRNNPFPEAADEPKWLHVYFFWSVPGGGAPAALKRLKADSERFLLDDRVLYLHAPKGIARSKLAASAERALGVTMTGRNWRTVTKMLELARTLG